jgi:hypothetical protein
MPLSARLCDAARLSLFLIMIKELARLIEREKCSAINRNSATNASQLKL